MTTKFWVKLYIEILDDPKMGRLPDNLWRLAVELFLLAGREGNDGTLPPVEEMAWTLRLEESKVLEGLRGLAEVGVTHEAQPGKWVVTNFQVRQTCESSERVKRYRERYRNAECNGDVAEGSSTSTSSSDSISDSEEGDEVQEKGEEIPRTPAEAMEHPDIRVFEVVTGGRIPGAAQYASVIDAMRFIRQRKRLVEGGLEEYLKPFWLAWSSRKRKDGRGYDPGNITWLTEWALNGTIPPPGGAGEKEVKHARVPSAEETRRMLAEKDEKLKKAVPAPKEVQARMRGLSGQMVGKDVP